MSNFPHRLPYPGYPYITNRYYPTYTYEPVYAFPEALKLITEAAEAEREDDIFYSYLVELTPPAQKEISMSIRSDELKHFKQLRELHWEVTGEELPPAPEASPKKPRDFCEGVGRAIFGELEAVERYRQILFGFEFLPYRNLIIEILTDELKHASKWNYLFSVNCR